MKINRQVAEQIIELHKQGLNPRSISLQLSLSRMAVRMFLAKQNITPNYRKDSINDNKYKQFINDVLNGTSVTEARKSHNISYEKANKLLDQNNIPRPTRQDAARKRRLSPDDVLKRIDSPTVKYLEFCKDTQKHKLASEDGKVFYKKSGKLKQGVPFGKYGTPLTQEDFINRISPYGYTLLTNFVNVSAHVTVKCNSGHTRTVRAERVLSQNCPSCQLNGVSADELELLEWVRGHYPNAGKYNIPKTEPSAGRSKEIDIYIPEIKLGIEYCGLYWHSEPEDATAAVEDRIAARLTSAEENKHYRKMQLANSAGIRLITIFENEWNHRRDAVKSFLMSALGVNGIKISARKCTLRDVDSTTAKIFCDTYHIQGYDKSAYANLGLYFGEELVAVMSAGRHPNRGKHNDTSMYLSRLCFKSGVTVRGGASKLFSSLIKIARKTGKENIVSWSDNRWSEGGVYRTLGFSLDRPHRINGKTMGLSDGSIWPEKYGTYRGNIISIQKAKQLLLEGVNPNHIRYIYDCGKKRWVYKL